MRAFTSSASKSKGPVDLGRNMLKSYFSGDGLDIHKAIGNYQNQKVDLLIQDLTILSSSS